MPVIAFIDSEVDPKSGRVFDLGALRTDGPTFHGSSIKEFTDFLRGAEYVCGHNILNHDLKYLDAALQEAGIEKTCAIDTLYLSPLLFPKKPYHKLLKDDKLQTDEVNNPLNDSIKARDLFYDEVHAFEKLDDELKVIYSGLLGNILEFSAFFRYLAPSLPEIPAPRQRRGFMTMFRRDTGGRTLTCGRIREKFQDAICSNSDLETMASENPAALAYSLALISALESDKASHSVTPSWVLHKFPEVEQLIFRLRNAPCREGCPYCERTLDIHKGLKRWFGFESFRHYGGEPLQEQAVRTAVENKSLLAVFPTGGGKSLAFQLPALMAGENTDALTVVISPLQSLMKDQVDNLERKGITAAATINGLLDPIERAKAFERVENGSVSILYISPESLRSRSIERLILGRKIARIVIDEAHCFSSWGQDFRVDYLYIADFINGIQKKKNLQWQIPVSCFTATAKPQVIEDIRGYFRDRLFIDLKLFKSEVSRQNLHYKVLPQGDEESRYQALRMLIEARSCPVIVYVTRTRPAEELAFRLSQDGFSARPYHGKMDADEKIKNQNAFMSGEVRIIVATSAFGMGVDKSDVGLVVHYQISDSLENYVQEAGRAGRDESIDADCYVLFNEEDLSRHFILLNQTKITVKEIQQVWKAVKELSKFRNSFTASALEIARMAGWDDGMLDVETRVKTAISSLEQAGYIRRGQNMPKVFATGILVKTAQEAIDRIEGSPVFAPKEKEYAKRIIKSLVSSRSRQRGDDEAESRVDYLADRLGITKENVIHTINKLREEKILADSRDITAYVYKGDSESRSRRILREFNEVENFLYPFLAGEKVVFDLKDLNETAEAQGLKSVNVKKMTAILNFWAIKGWIRKGRASGSRNQIPLRCLVGKEGLGENISVRQKLAAFIVDYLYENAGRNSLVDRDEILLDFSVLAIKNAWENSLAPSSVKVSCEDVEEALFYLSRTGAIKIEGGFMVIYNTMKIERLELDNRKLYRQEEYRNLARFYENRIQQIHIVGEYAKKMIDDYKGALQFVEDYFNMSYPLFLEKYFRGRKTEISRNITPAKFKRIFGELSASQLNIIKDNSSRTIVVAAGPGSGKTRILVHKLASLLLMEDVRHDQMLMLTFSRAAATEFKQRLYELIGAAAAFVEIKTFHSYCFDLLGRTGNLEMSNDVVSQAVAKIRANEVDLGRITKTVLVIDEAQDMEADEYNLVRELIGRNDELRVIAVGDDDQNIYAFRGSDSKYMEELMNIEGAVKYELVENFRSRRNLVEFSDRFARCISHRLKEHQLVPVRRDDGQIRLVAHTSRFMSEAVVEDLLGMNNIAGTTAVLSRTNDEALEIAGLLRKRGIPVKLVQSNEGFNLDSLIELRFFMDCLRFNESTSKVDWEDWEEAKRQLSSRFRGSEMLEICLNLITAFESCNRRTIYKSDFKSFLRESGLEDFVDAASSSIIVSTMHKVKGKEFNNVFLLLDGKGFQNKDEDNRLLYVALTRAKDNISLHFDGSMRSRFAVGGVEIFYDRRQYAPSNERTLLLTHRDVWLNDFINRQRAISFLRAGDALNVTETGCSDLRGNTVLKFSAGFRNKLDQFREKGYSLAAAKVNYILWWQGEDMKSPVKVVLPELNLVRRS